MAPHHARAALLALAIAAASIAPARAHGGGKEALTLGVVLPLTGDKSEPGIAEQKAVGFAVADFGHSLLPGYKISVVSGDSQCQAALGPAAFTGVVAAGARAVLGDICSGASLAELPFANAAKAPLVSGASGSSALSIAGDFFYRTIPSDTYQGIAAAELIYGNGGRKCALVVGSTPFGQGLAADFSAAYLARPGASIPLSLPLPFPPTANDAVDAVAALVAAQANLDSVFLSTNNNTFIAEFVKQVTAQGLQLALFGGGGVADPTLFALVGSAPSALGSLKATIVSPGTTEFRTQWAVRTDDYPYHPGVAHIYDATVAVLRAFRQAAGCKLAGDDDCSGRPPKKQPPCKALKEGGGLGAVSGGALRLALQAQDFEGVSGRILFDVFGDLQISNQSYVECGFDVPRQKLVYGKPIPIILE